MQEHPIPRQITTFEFKLIGELTIKQFGFLAFGIALGAVLFFLVPNIFFLNFILAAMPTILGIGFAFVPVNDRPMDIWLKNLFKRLFSPTQYFYHKHNAPPKILLGLQLPPREVLLQHIKAQQSLNEYLQKKPKTGASDNMEQIDQNLTKKKQDLQNLMAGTAFLNTSPKSVLEPSLESRTTAYTPIQANSLPEKTITNLNGVVLTSNGIPISNQMVYLKKGAETVRLFKTNNQGEFQNNLPLPPGDYFLEIQDPQRKHDFARMKVDSQTENLQIFAQK